MPRRPTRRPAPLEALLASDAAANQRLWLRSDRNPVITPQGTGWAEDFLAVCSVVEHDGGLRLYTEGSVGGHEQIGLFTGAGDDPAEVAWTQHAGNPLVRVGDGFDAGGVFDPSVVRLGGRWLLYYSATEGDAHAFAEHAEHAEHAGTGGAEQPSDETIGLATSVDGIAFAKHPQAPVLRARCPFAVVHEGLVHLFHVRVAAGGYRVHLAVSDDGVRFREVDGPVLDVGMPGTWDAHTVTTPKVFRDGDRWCMAYAGGDARLDDPTGIGVAFSDDLRRWRRHPGNPVFTVGREGEFDGVSVQSPVVRRVADRYYLWYAGSDRLVRDGLHSQVGLAWLDARP
jgi:predicted GH43/DUF377 family glycosyl hydrolase